MKTELDSCLIDSIEEMNANREIKISLDAPSTLILYGETGVFDSMELVNFLMIVEEKLAERLGREISLTSERAISRANSPFRSIAFLSDFIIEEIGLCAAA